MISTDFSFSRENESGSGSAAAHSQTVEAMNWLMSEAPPPSIGSHDGGSTPLHLLPIWLLFRCSGFCERS
jgi:hypothetical protein